jgi:hypothetical protein
MKKKLLLLIALVFLLCGCTAEVNINVGYSNIEETISITTLADNNLTKETIKKSFRVYMPAFENDIVTDTDPDEKIPSVSYYSYISEELSNGYKNTYGYRYSFDEFKNSTSVKEAFRSVTIQNDKVDGEIMLSTDTGGLLLFNAYPKLDSVKVNIKSEYKVKETNADSHKDNVYTWTFTRGNDKKNIYILYDKGHKWDEKEPEKPENPDDPSNPGKTDPGKTDPSGKLTVKTKQEKNHLLLVIVCAACGTLLILWFVFKGSIIKEK